MASKPQDDENLIEVDYTSDRIQHLDFVQRVVTRLAGNSATMKRYSVALAAIGVGLYQTLGDSQVVSALIAIVFVFWWLDARYLEDEKRFRNLYDSVRTEPRDRRPDFRLTPDSRRDVGSILSCLINWSTTPLYVALIVLLILFWVTQ